MKCVSSHHSGRGLPGGDPKGDCSAAVAAAHTARPHRPGRTRDQPSPREGRHDPHDNAARKGAARGPERPRPEASGSHLPLPERGEALQVQAHVAAPSQGRGGSEPPGSVRALSDPNSAPSTEEGAWKCLHRKQALNAQNDCE
ncbi:hypothetical protein NDU88_007773 [Pleurodeles waltl]|uniref:Uncharacterized protein n=1 Tax=Pleurodeles waltl TaxID=8319 RepID=A0AAV7STQ9_PLEWA|nr:hypothetical protein NDU88_007773 [Pleurodeles waltl]